VPERRTSPWRNETEEAFSALGYYSRLTAGTKRRDGGMQRMTRQLRWVTIAVLTLAAGLWVSGCSLVGSDVPDPVDYGMLEGTVTSDRGVVLSGITVELWDEDGEWSFQTTTDVHGWYSFDEVEMETEHAHTRDCELYVNRTRAALSPINANWQAWWSEVGVVKGGSEDYDIELDEGGGVDDPESFIDT
jgi:hypothetical protein